MNQYGLDKRNEAFTIFLKSQGTESLSALARKLDVNRKTLAEWKKEDDWDAKLAVTTQETAKKTIEKISESQSDEIAKHFEIDFGHLDILDKIIFLQLIERHERGQPVRGPDGLLRPNSKLSPSDLRKVAATRHQVSSTKRMLLGLPNPNQKVEQEDTQNQKQAKPPGRVHRVARSRSRVPRIHRQAVRK